MPPDGHRSEGTPSFSEVPYAWGEPFWVLFWRLKKVPRRKGETLSRRYRSNGYVHLQKKVGCQAAIPSRQAPTGIEVHPQKTGRLPGRYRWQASSRDGSRHSARGRSTANFAQ